MMTREEVLAWLEGCPVGSNVAIGESGLDLQCDCGVIGSDEADCAYIEIGGWPLPDKSER